MYVAYAHTYTLMSYTHQRGGDAGMPCRRPHSICITHTHVTHLYTHAQVTAIVSNLTKEWRLPDCARRLSYTSKNNWHSYRLLHKAPSLTPVNPKSPRSPHLCQMLRWSLVLTLIAAILTLTPDRPNTYRLLHNALLPTPYR